MASPIIYLIRHGEKPPKVNGEDQNGLSEMGMKRSEALVQVFRKESGYDIGYILAEKPKKDGSHDRPSETVTPLANTLGLTVDTSISRDDSDGAANRVKQWCENYDGSGPGNILICWEHGQLSEIAKAIGIKGYGSGVPNAVQTAGTDKGKLAYPDDRFDLIWTVEAPYEEIKSVTSESCPGLDDGHVDP